MKSSHTISSGNRFRNFILIFIPAFYLIGAIGLHTGFRDFFLALTPLTLIASFFALFLSRADVRKEYSIFIGLIFLFGFLIELLGVQTGFPFGKYDYGTALGPKIGGVPVVIGINWLLVIFITGDLSERICGHRFAGIFLAATCTTLLDILIEPAAIQLGYWSWESGNPPFQNYFAWFFSALVFFGIGWMLGIRYRSWLSPAMLIANVLFFLINAFV